MAEWTLIAHSVEIFCRHIVMSSSALLARSLPVGVSTFHHDENQALPSPHRPPRIPPKAIKAGLEVKRIRIRNHKESKKRLRCAVLQLFLHINHAALVMNFCKGYDITTRHFMRLEEERPVFGRTRGGLEAA